MSVHRAVAVAVVLVVLSLVGTGALEARENYRSVFYRAEVRSMSLEQIAASGETCIQCHERVTPRVAAEHKSGVHFKAGVSCEACHGTNHAAMMVVTGKKVCSKCHQSETQEMLSSKHANSWQNSWRNARYEVLPKSMRQQGCARCHDISYGLYDVKDVRCDYCHTSHEFSLEQARSPLTCYTCHMGPDHPQAESYEASSHGKIYKGEADKENGSAPTCVTCHQSKTSHDVSQNISFGGVSNGGILNTWNWFKDNEGKPLMKRSVLTSEQFLKAREGAILLCSRCHDRSVSQESLAKADKAKEFADRQLAEGFKLITGLNDAGLLYPNPQTRPANPVEGQKLVLGGNQLYTDISKAEAIYFQMFKFAGTAGWKSAYHQDFQRAEAEAQKLQKLGRELQEEADILKILGTSAPVIEPPQPESQKEKNIKFIIACAVGLLAGILAAGITHYIRKKGKPNFTGMFLGLMLLGGLLYPQDHAFAWDKDTQKQCASCHQVQVKSLNSGKHSGLKCLDCHRQGAGVEQVKRPETCGKCHSGEKGYQLEAYMTSPHGIKYRIKGPDKWTPTCATCHMSGGVHNPVTRAENQPLDQSNLGKVCLNCHITDEMKKFAGDLDDIYKNTDNSASALKQVGIALIDKGVLVLKDKDVDDIETVKAMWGTETNWKLVNEEDLPQQEQQMARKLVSQLVDKTRTGVREAAVKTKIGAAHINPDYTHWYGNAYLNLSLAEVQGTARELEMFSYKAGFRGRQNNDIVHLLPIALLTFVLGYFATVRFIRKSF